MIVRCSLLATAVSLASCAEAPPEPQAPPPAEPEPIACDCTLSSWRVAGRGRHLHLDIDCPDEFDHLDGRVEFTSATLRSDFDASLLAPADRPALVRMTPGRTLASWTDDPQPRLEAEYEVDVTVAAWLQRDIAFEADYVLVGTNSNSAMRAVMQRAGLAPPDRVRNGAGILGEFPGIDRNPGGEVDPSTWREIGLPMGPQTPSGPMPDGWDALGIIGQSNPAG